MAQTWQVTLNMENQRLGVEAEPAAEGRALLVKDIQPGGAVAVWNLSNPPSKGVRPGDHIIEMNGVTGAAEMIQECKAGKKKLQITCEGPKRTDMPSPPGAPNIAAAPRPDIPSGGGNRIIVRLDMGIGLKLGIDMDYQTDPRAIIIKDVKPDGAVMHWNRSNPPSQTVNAGDRIVAVNDVAGDAKSMINEGTKAFKGKLKVNLTVESQRAPNLIVTPGGGGGGGMKRNAPNSYPAPPGGDQISVFSAQWGLTPEAENFLRQVRPDQQEVIMRDFKPANDTRDFTARFLIFAKSIVNAAGGLGVKGQPGARR